MDPLDRHSLKRPPAMGEMKRVADAQALTLRAELRATMRARELTAADVARLARLDLATLDTFLAGASLNPRWQEKLARWLETTA
ncbi:MAG: hypothetical protein IVW57_09555 [Ktedonobacterales bacterium]|nr:hypothetical protein [Ktedonobacterales bacterium]